MSGQEIQRFFEFSEAWTGEQGKEGKGTTHKRKECGKKPREGQKWRRTTWELRNGDSAPSEHTVPRHSPWCLVLPLPVPPLTHHLHLILERKAGGGEKLGHPRKWGIVVLRKEASSPDQGQEYSCDQLSGGHIALMPSTIAKAWETQK